MADTPKGRFVARDEAAHQAGTKQVSDYLRRYPDISDEELADLIARYRELPSVEMALLASDQALASKVELFRSQHRRETRLPFRQYAVLVAIAVIWFMIIGYSVATKL